MRVLNPSKPNWNLGRYYECAGQDVDAVGLDLKKFVSRLAKDDLEVRLAAQRLRSLAGGEGCGLDGGDAAADVPASGARAKGSARRRRQAPGAGG